MKTCEKCQNSYSVNNFISIKKQFFCEGHLPICKNCIQEMIKLHGRDYKFFSKLCQWVDIPLFVKEWNEIYKYNKEKSFEIYVSMYQAGEFDNSIDWETINNKYKELDENGSLDKEFIELTEDEIKILKRKWGENYLQEELYYLEDLLQEIYKSHNVNGGLQIEDAKRLCKISLILDQKIRAGENFKDELQSYKDLHKICGFTAKETKNADEFDSVGEIYAYLEKTGWINKFYTGAEKDIVDSTMSNIQSYLRELYTNETNISEEIEKKITALKEADELQKDKTDIPEDDLDNYEIDDFNLLDEEEEFHE